MPERLLARAPNAWIATGHYARLLPSPLDPTLPALYRGANIRKDQSHYLSTAPVHALARTLFPLGEFASKDAVRDLANRWGMHTGEKKDSMGICFVGVRKGFSGFLGKTIWQCLDVETRSSAHLPATNADSYLPASPGNIVDANGKVVGRHQGLWRYTVGERARLSGLPEAVFVGRKDPEKNVVVVVPKR